VRPLQAMTRLRTSKEGNKSMSSSPIRMRNERRPMKNRRRESWREKVMVRTRMRMRMRTYQQKRNQRKRKTMCLHPLKLTPLSFLCQGRARLQVLRRLKGPRSTYSPHSPPNPIIRSRRPCACEARHHQDRRPMSHCHYSSRCLRFPHRRSRHRQLLAPA
jgi:hypothetical protein